MRRIFTDNILQSLKPTPQHVLQLICAALYQIDVAQ